MNESNQITVTGVNIIAGDYKNREGVRSMQYAAAAGILVLAYVIGSIPFGLLIVRLSTGKDIRQIESGRTGGTNAMRAAGFWAGLFTTIMDFLKSASAAWLARALLPDFTWVHVLAPIMAIVGHNYSIFLGERAPNGGWRLRGGAGGAPSAGGAFGLWAPSVLVIVPIAGVILYFIGYASLATLSTAVIATFLFAYLAWIGISPWMYVLYGILAGILLAIALRPNIQRLMKGNERLIGLRAKRKKAASNAASHN